ncbi:MAG: hypothetical protein KIT60_12420 [Burkholderiaceae bacterium]|nr:hypothetical protein [Burkholderiaceae bacterium]
MNRTVARSSMGAAVMVLASAASATDLSRIESCVSASAIEFGALDQRVVLDADDQARVHAEMQQRYPVLAQHGFPVSRIVLWQKTGGDALFIALLEHPSKPDQSCFTATFAAARFAGIGTLKRKYLRPELSS